MTQEEHLNRIMAKCRELLAIAEKRTPGKWERIEIGNHVGVGLYNQSCSGWWKDCCPTCDQRREINASFIAACAGPAEAGWKNTIEEIETLIPVLGAVLRHPSLADYAETRAAAIIISWPEELL